ncbi:MAG: hypothetical protein H0V70_11655 [Ktedonobacteraceae bacterium]|nr:hypothetical protein [Ktedonobacteraceae bacterium]
MSDFSPSEHNNAGSGLPDKPFAHLPLIFLLKPLLITGHAMDHYGLGASNDYVFLVPKPEFERLWEAFPEGRLTTADDERGVRLGTYDFYGNMLGFSYYELEIEAQEERDYIILHDEFLLFLNTLTLIRDPENQQARQNALAMLEKLGVWPPG